MTQAPKWRRTALTRYDGSPMPDDWTLVDERGQAVGRIYKMTGGPQDAHWFWTMLVDAQGRPWNGGTGSCPTGPEAKAAVEARVSPGSAGGYRDEHLTTTLMAGNHPPESGSPFDEKANDGPAKE